MVPQHGDRTAETSADPWKYTFEIGLVDTFPVVSTKVEAEVGGVTTQDNFDVGFGLVGDSPGAISLLVDTIELRRTPNP